MNKRRSSASTSSRSKHSQRPVGTQCGSKAGSMPSCNYCNETLNDSREVRLHERSCTKKAPPPCHRCSICDTSWPTIRSLTAHQTRCATKPLLSLPSEPALRSINQRAQPVVNGPMQPHSAVDLPPPLSLPSLPSLPSSSSPSSSVPPNIHQMLPPLLPCPLLVVRPKIILPRSDQKSLISSIDENLEAALATTFPPGWLTRAPIDEVGRESFRFLYDFLSKQCGTVAPKEMKQPSATRKPHSHSKLRQMKNRLKKVLNHCRKHNLHIEYAKARSEYSKVSRQLGQLNKLSRLHHEKTAAVRAQLEFNKDHWKFAKKLFDPAPSALTKTKQSNISKTPTPTVPATPRLHPHLTYNNLLCRQPLLKNFSQAFNFSCHS